ncbi:MAG: PIN domain-containing protein [Candidatus Micrarchaeota archaeon]
MNLKSFVVDSYAWMSYFHEKSGFKELIDENILKTPAIVVAEITRVLEKHKEPEEKIREALKIILEKSTILELDFKNAVKAGELAANEKMHLSDAIVYAYASNEEEVLTGDKDFAGKPFVKLVK